MVDIRCKNCNYLFGKNMDVRSGNMKCPKCNAMTVVEYNKVLTLPRKSEIVRSREYSKNKSWH